ncbi:hypothetical protein COCCADRAFT_33781 [Bipolaris zeicola 26-R-13]|uniref:Uncharacterized protein n=1 Tax=Cochliobolus carbonum (strain 26-R-13) TaxID=930089 RepID=W6YN56_COCC2|nr:uncharacterized protein COCCADRAFT_33781 [Bipolaris zeicola 26-R-13]EUC36959.1 hypothetical protein COCCADRAFT_33781 [Bipolaris zeicola 26-R-13]
MKEFIGGPGLVGKVVEHDIPQPGVGQVVVKVAAAGSTQKTGIPNGSFAEYAVIEVNTAWVLGPQTTFEEAATAPLNVCIAATGLYLDLKPLVPWLPAKEPTPLIVWGATSAVGSYAVQLAYLEDFIDRSQGDTILDYRDSEDDIKEGIRNAAGGREILHAIEGTMGTGGHIALVLFEKEYTGIPSHVTHNKYNVSVVHESEKDFGFGGLNGVITAFERLKAGEAHAVKYVIKP